MSRIILFCIFSVISGLGLSKDYLTDGDYLTNSIDDYIFPEENVPNYSNYRLPAGVIPLSYSIELSFLSFIDQLSKPSTFGGSVNIKFRADDPLINSITFHIKDITIHNYSLKKDTFLPSKSLKIISEEYSSKLEQFTIRLEKYLEHGSKYVLKITYSGKISNESSGFFMTPYKNVNFEAK